MDIISALSDDLLLRILSLVPTKDVVATSLLSKRWRSLWKSVPKLAYNDSQHTGDYKIFSQFVYRSLLSNKAPILDKLYLKLGADCPFIDIELWITIALSRPLRELEIDVVSKERSLILPSSLYIYLGHTRALVTQQLRFPERSSVRLSPVSKNSEPGACRLH
ncbi:F-box/FBD/LRR-repeat protein [Raphanus sativus]|nr:F-box/FBD/LRR-repeat protein [Raphanus sativus]